MKKNPNSAMWKLCDGDLEQVSGRTAYDGMRANDPAACEVVDAYVKYVACGIINTINTFQPETLCIGGGISKEGDTLLDPVKKLVDAEEFCRRMEKKVELKIAMLGNDAGIIGAAYIHRLYQKNK